MLGLWLVTIRECWDTIDVISPWILLILSCYENIVRTLHEYAALRLGSQT